MSWLIPAVFLFGVLIGAVAIWGLLSSSRMEQSEYSAESYLGRAVLALVRDDTEYALQNLVQLLNKNTENIDAYMALSNLYREKGWFNRAIDIRRRLLSRSILRPHQRRSIMLEMVRDFESAGLIDRAVNAMAAILEATDATRQDHEMLARLHESAGHLGQAYEHWKKAGKTEHQAYIRVEQARELYQAEDYRTARKAIGQALKLHRDNPAALLLMGEISAREGQIRQAEKLFDKLQSLRPDLTGVIADTIESVAAENHNEKLMSFFVSILEAQKAIPRVAVRYAAWCAANDRLDDARQTIETIRTDTLAPEMMVRLVDTASACGMTETTARLAVETIHRFLDTKPFVCHGCKELIPTLEWKCPKCGQWGLTRSRTAYAISKKETS